MKRILLAIIIWTVTVSGQVQVKTDPSVPYSFGYARTITATWTDTLSRELDTLAQVQAGYGGFAQCNSLFDTLTSTITPFKQFWTASIMTDDTLEISTVGSFPAYDKVIVLPDMPITVGTYNKGKTNLYIRRYTGVSGPSGNPNYYIYVWGW